MVFILFIRDCPRLDLPHISQLLLCSLPLLLSAFPINTMWAHVLSLPGTSFLDKPKGRESCGERRGLMRRGLEDFLFIPRCLVMSGFPVQAPRPPVTGQPSFLVNVQKSWDLGNQESTLSFPRTWEEVLPLWPLIAPLLEHSVFCRTGTSHSWVCASLPRAQRLQSWLQISCPNMWGL